jgi:hypothetical protein
MAKRRGNSPLGKAAPLATPSSLSTFEHVVKALRLSPDQYKNSVKLKEWVRRNRNDKYVPSELLHAWGFHVETEVLAEHSPGNVYSLRLRPRSRIRPAA